MKVSPIAMTMLGLAGIIALAFYGEAAHNEVIAAPSEPAAVIEPDLAEIQKPRIVDSPEADETYLTIYPDNLALVTEVRRVSLPEGPVKLRILGVSDQIISQTAVLQSFEGLSLERNFDADLITKGALINKAVGSELTIRRINPATGDVEAQTAKLISASQLPNTAAIQGAVFETQEGIEALECSGLYETILFSQMPNGLNPSPVLSMDVRSDSAGEKDITISYLTQGIGWAADYRLDVNNDHTEGALNGWLTVTNSTSKTFDNVPTAIVAGEVNQDENTQAERALSNSFYPTCWRKGSTKTGIPINLGLYEHDNYEGSVLGWDGGMYASAADIAPSPVMMKESFADEIIVTASKRQATREDLGDYKLYRTPQPVTVAAYQTKQIAFLSVPDAEIDPLYKFELRLENYGDELLPANIEYDIDNSHEGRLAQPLPRGTVRVMMTRPNGMTAFLGEDSVRDLAVDLPIEVSLSESLNVKMRADITANDTPGNPSLRLSGVLFNAMPEAVTAEIEIKDDRVRGPQIGRESHERDPFETVPTYRVPVPAGDSTDFYIDLPVEKYYRFAGAHINYRRNRDTQTASSAYAFKGQGQANDFVSSYFPNFDGTKVRMRSEFIESEIFRDEDGQRRVRYTERHVITNALDKPAHVRLDFFGIEGLTLIEASQSPYADDSLMWDMKIDAWQTAELTLTWEADEVP